MLLRSFLLWFACTFGLPLLCMAALSLREYRRRRRVERIAQRLGLYVYRRVR